ncbi:hypothetical protein HUE87_06480 [Candidatus Sulfurimonas marisnigri]|uniref:Lipoprotein n=1 Tax=Candidatus Sulfurimonas marisnigri TaxID=2740405 RepID=A0A7S7LYC7_9BACT|nr:hypothetical protein [Candidatus Sulfurimonas marisnigri]QOY53570.1 hypothetical protein HUE87_06480 [Candidatus Sulfurimonas marisnigri]
MKISRFITTSILGATLAIIISGCSAANVHSNMRIADANSNMETRCVELDMRDQKDMDETLAKYDGWRVFYISEYTTGNKIGTHGSVCFERQK